MITLLDKPEELMKYKGEISIKSYQAFVGLSDETLLWMYQVGDQFFGEQRFEEAFAIFSLVTQLNPLVCDFWIAFALTQMRQNDPSEALKSFAFAIVADPSHPIPRYQSAKLYLQLEQKQDAMIELEVLEEIIRLKQLDSLSPLVTELKELIGGS